MKVIYVNTPTQGPETETPQLIDGEVKHWEVRAIKLRGNETLNGWIKREGERGDIEYLLIHEIESMNRYFCDQGCKPGEGCKKEYSEDNHALMVSYYKIKK